MTIQNLKQDIFYVLKDIKMLVMRLLDRLETTKNVSILSECSVLKSREPYSYNVLFCTNSKAFNFYLIPHMMTFVAWKQSWSRFSEQLDFSGSEIIAS